MSYVDHSLRSSIAPVAFAMLAALGPIAACGPMPTEAPINSPPKQMSLAERLQKSERDQQAAFEAQSPNPAASKVAQARFDNVAKAVAGTRKATADCRGTTCRLQTEHESNTAFAQFFQAAVVDVRTAWRGSVRVVRIDRSASGVAAVAFLGPEQEGFPAQVTAQTPIRGCPSGTDCPTGGGPVRGESTRKPPEAP
jgi:hypothetical protein